MVTAPLRQDEIALALRRMDQEFVRNALAGDPERLVDAFYAPDAQLLPPNRPPVRGRFELAAYWRGVLAAGLQRLELDTTQVEASGDLACAIGRYSMTVQPPGADPVTAEGKYLVVYRRQPDGGWRAVADMFSPNAG